MQCQKNSVSVFYVKVTTWKLECWLINTTEYLIGIILNNECTHVGAIQEKNCLVTQKYLLKLHS